jgi:predicted RNA-binding Zn-ribbon protein involved in translation (DUF1610 family)
MSTRIEPGDVPTIIHSCGGEMVPDGATSWYCPWCGASVIVTVTFVDDLEPREAQG